ncbi:hypothetical protein GGR56DRAFT_446576 [Xylariaceae sp. FL0804]|nr:hypothetical protein GGR56DRAFT_446576 [Xylariaceae sp. FL0804]
MDPLHQLPAELVLRILHFASLSTVAALARLSRAWCHFIESSHREVVYASKLPPRRRGSAGPVDLREPGRYLQGLDSFSRYGQGVESWKEVCRRHVLLERSWTSERLCPRETLFQVSRGPVWRFKPDFKRRFIISTSHAGGVRVADMDTGEQLWSLDTETVRRFAHLEYQDGVAVWDCFRNTLEVWRTDLPGLRRGEFRRIALLPHEVLTRGFQLSHDALCVASSEGEGFVYDIQPGEAPPTLRKRLEINEGAVGHLDQSADAVMYSMGTQDYHLHDKTSGELLGHIHPHHVDPSRIYHIAHPVQSMMDEQMFFIRYMPFRPAKQEGLTRLHIGKGPLYDDDEAHPPPYGSLWTDEWGAGMLSGDTMVGVSRSGRLIVVSDWRRALRSQDEFAAVSSVVECAASGDTFDLGGWLHISETAGGKRVIFEVKDSIYILPLDAEGRLLVDSEGDGGLGGGGGGGGGPSRPPDAFAAPSCSRPELAVPVSFMGVYNDCIMSTFTSLGHEPVSRGAADGGDPGEVVDEDLDPLEAANMPRRHFLTKAIRVLDFAPEL